ncbi:hypothetical protein [Mycetocola saprophilus]|uniref:hypothetical protein n=1 Tax=Mycetocola saprophilus TaxID=76636 RepID=UPI003BEFC78E
MSDATEITPVRSGLPLVLGATAVAGVLGFVIQFGMGRILGKTPEYTEFMAFWSAFFLAVGAIAGVQQEYSRAVAEGQRSPALASSGVSARGFALSAALVIALILGVSGLAWGPGVFSTDWPIAVLLIAIGGGAYVLFSAINGNLYGRERWSLVTVGIIADPLLRLILLAVAVVAVASMENALRAAIIVPVVLTVLLLAALGSDTEFGTTRLGSSARQITWNILRTVGGAASTAALISGYPLFLAVFGGSGAAAATVIFVFTIVRAPIVIPMLALQNFMIVHFGKAPERVAASAARLMAAVIAGALVLSGLAAWIAPWFIDWVTNGQYNPNPWLVAAMVATAGLTGALCVSGAATVALNRHSGFVAGWAVAAVVSILLLLLPGPIEQRALIALAAGPALGLVVHFLALRRS